MKMGSYRLNLKEGDKFGEWTFMYRVSGQRAVWKCKCGKIRERIISDIVNGKSKSCGCAHKRKRKEHKVGQKKNYLTLLKELDNYVSPAGHIKRRGLYKCDCGREKVFHIDDVNREKFKSCGKCQEKKSNKIQAAKGDVVGDHGVLFIKDSGIRKSNRMSLFKCPLCPNTFETCFHAVKSNHTKSCGCRLEHAYATKYPYSKLYIVKMHNDHEVFYKIGITSNTLKRRLKGLGYSWEEVYLSPTQKSTGVTRVESIVKMKLIDTHKYIPLKLFGGSNECFQMNDKELNELIFFIKQKLVNNTTLKKELRYNTKTGLSI